MFEISDYVDLPEPRTQWDEVEWNENVWRDYDYILPENKDILH